MKCQCTYESKRFFWENGGTPEAEENEEQWNSVENQKAQEQRHVAILNSAWKRHVRPPPRLGRRSRRRSSARLISARVGQHHLLRSTFAPSDGEISQTPQNLLKQEATGVVETSCLVSGGSCVDSSEAPVHQAPCEDSLQNMQVELLVAASCADAAALHFSEDLPVRVRRLAQVYLCLLIQRAQSASSSTSAPAAASGRPSSISTASASSSASVPRKSSLTFTPQLASANGASSLQFAEKEKSWSASHCKEFLGEASCASFEQESDEEKKKSGRRPSIQVQEIAVRADVVRATGTCANVVGSMAPLGHVVLAPFSVLGGAVGVSAGAAQLHEGLSAPSGNVDPHLVAKGAVTTGVGTTCMLMGAGAAMFPYLFVGALAVGVAGLGAATAIDATMDGLCESCRAQAHALEDNSKNDCDDDKEDKNVADEDATHEKGKASIEETKQVNNQEPPTCSESSIGGDSWQEWLVGKWRGQ